MWLIYSFLAPAFFSAAEIIDNFFSNRKFKHPFALVFYSSLFNLIYVPILFIFQRPTIPPLATLPIFICLGFVGFGYLYPYYKALKYDDTSVAISFLAIERLLVPVLAFFIVGEVLAPIQYLGIFLIIASVVALGLHHAGGTFKLSRGLWYIALASLLLALEGVLQKLLFDEGLSVSTVIGGESIISFILGVSLIAVPRIRREITSVFWSFIRLSHVFLVEEFLTFLGSVTEATAISLASVSIVKGITMSSPFFLILYAWLGGSLFPSLFKEDLHRKKVLHKVLFFAVLILGVVLVQVSE
jgi:drug/metabolite transporter (DMT)-like permease